MPKGIRAWTSVEMMRQVGSLTETYGGWIMMRRRRGFTLIELLVVIAIIGILAAMVFPVFARARESARKAVCLSNMKNIALAVQMYLGDYNDFWPGTIDPGGAEFFSVGPGGGNDDPGTNCKYGYRCNPYLQVPVVLDEYTKNRDVWRCSSAKFDLTIPFILPMPAQGPWWKKLEQELGNWGVDTGLQLCTSSLPPGWGGAITDSFVQGPAMNTKSGQGAGDRQFVQDYTAPLKTWGLKSSHMSDAASWIIIGEYSMNPDWSDLADVAYSDVCKVKPWNVCADLSDTVCDCRDWENCPWSQECGPPALKFWSDPTMRKPFARHLGGTNVGFADGHAAWIPSEALLASPTPDGPSSDKYNDGTANLGTPHACLTYYCGTPWP
jgi:prepilin-type N-terminal cleavage/methylation domain-containing protein/prepilin-type processing-associated H-X9-DG protein